MAKEKFLLVSLSENKAKQLSQAISNETCRKILDYLADKEATETELAKKLIQFLLFITISSNCRKEDWLFQRNIITAKKEKKSIITN